MSPQTAKELRSRRRHAADMERARVEAAWLRFLLYLQNGHERWGGDRSHKLAARKKRRYKFAAMYRVKS